MRWVMAAFWIWIAVGLWSAQTDVRAENPVATNANPMWPEAVQGFGLTQELARQDALKETVRLVGVYLQHLRPPVVEWRPSVDYVQQHLIQGRGSPGPDVRIPESAQGKSWILPLRKPDLTEFTHLDHQATIAREHQQRQAVSADRLLLTGKVFLLLLVAQAVVFCYYRLRTGPSSR